MLKTLTKAPFPYFGGKTDAAPAVWDALGDVCHYAEPFAGSLAVLLRRPHPCNRVYFSETVNDIDGFLVNTWRAIQRDPMATAEWASWPVSEADVMARHCWLLKWKDDAMVERLMADPDFYDSRAAGYWLYGISAWIGSGWCSGKGSWIVGDDGRITKRTTSDADGVSRRRPHLTNNGQGINHPSSREPGLLRKLPNITDDGRGITHPGSREPGVSVEPDYHPMAMPELVRWFAFLSARLRHVRILNGDWNRLCTSGALKTLPVRTHGGIAGVFLDPPYGHAATRNTDLYNHDSLDVADAVREWCIANGDDPAYRIVLAGFAEEHEELSSAGWRSVEWYKTGFLKGGMANFGDNGTQQHRERLWLSPHCLSNVAPQPRQHSLLDMCA